MRAEPDRAIQTSQGVIAKMAQRQRDLLLIELSSAEWAVPVVLVPNADGTMLFCVDCRQRNEVAARFMSPSPCMDDCIDFLEEAKVYSTLDANLRYGQIPMADKD